MTHAGERGNLWGANQAPPGIPHTGWGHVPSSLGAVIWPRSNPCLCVETDDDDDDDDVEGEGEEWGTEDDDGSDDYYL